MQKYHPDKNPDKPEYEKISKVINSNKDNLEVLLDIENYPEKYFGENIASLLENILNMSKTKMINYIQSLRQKLNTLEDEISEIEESDQLGIYNMYHQNKPEFEKVVQASRDILNTQISQIQEEIDRVRG